MSDTKVRSYTDKQIIDRLKNFGWSLPSELKITIIGVQSNEDTYDIYDDKFYVYIGKEFFAVLTGTTNAGSKAIKNFKRYNPNGVAVWQTNVFYEDCFQARGYHYGGGGKMRALRLIVPIFHFRDKNRDKNIEETGELFYSNINANFHGQTYDFESNKIGKYIGGWSASCQVANNNKDYRKIINKAWEINKPVNYCLLKEWEV